MAKIISDERFFELCDKWAQKKDALDVETFSNKHIMSFNVVTRLLNIEFVYYKKPIFPAPKRSLVCRVYFKKNSILYFLLSDLLLRFSENDFRATTFAGVTQENIEPCLSALFSILDEYMPKFESAYMDYQDEQAYQALFDEYRRIYKIKPEEFDFSKIDDPETENFIKFINLQSHRELYLIFKFTQSLEYTNFVLGNIDESIKELKKLEKKGELYDYEKRLLEFLKTPAAEHFEAVPRACMPRGKSGYTILSSQQENRDFPRNTLICFPPLLVFFCSLMAIIMHLTTRGSLIPMQPIWIFGILAALLCAIFAGITFRRKIIKLLDKEKAEQNLMLDEMVNSKKLNVFVSIFFSLLFAGSLAACVAFAASCPAVYEDRVSYAEVPFVYEDYRFDKIKEVYHIDARYNDYGDRIERSSYILVMDDGRIFDLDCTVTDAQFEKIIQPVLKAHNISPVYLDSDKDLPAKL